MALVSSNSTSPGRCGDAEGGVGSWDGRGRLAGGSRGARGGGRGGDEG